MKITVENIKQEYPKINIPLPEPLAQDKFEKLTTTFLPNYDKSDVIKKMVDTFVQKLNEAVAKATPKKETKPKSKPASKPKAKAQPKKSAEKPNNLAELKRFLKKGMKLYFFHRFTDGKGNPVLGLERIVQQVQSKSFSMITPQGKESWLEFPKASEIIFTDKSFRIDQGWVVMEYFYDEMPPSSVIVNWAKGTVKETSKKPGKKKAKEPEVPLIPHWRESQRLIRRFHAAIGKERQRRSILHIYRDIDRRLTEKKVSVIEGSHATLLKQIQSKLKKVLEYMEEKGLTHITIEPSNRNAYFFEEVEKAATRQKIRPSVNLLKRFIGIEGEIQPDVKKVKRIYDAFQKAVKSKKVTADDVLADEFKEALEAMKGYLDGDTDSIEISPATLRGLAGLGKPKTTTRKEKSCAKSSGDSERNMDIHLDGISQEPVIAPPVVPPIVPPGGEPVVVNRFQVDISQPVEQPVVETEDNQPEKEELSGLFSPITYNPPESTHDKIDLPGDLGRFLGYVERYEYSILLRGEKGAGKTRMLYQMMNTFAKAGFKVGCFSLEIGKQSNLIRDMRNQYISPTIANKVFIADNVPNGLEDIKAAARQFDVVAIDSWGKIPGTKADDFDKLRKEFPKTMFIVIFQSTTNGTARGGSMPEYDAGIVIQVADGGRAYCEKNRYNGEDLTYLVFQRKLEEPEPQPAV